MRITGVLFVCLALFSCRHPTNKMEAFEYFDLKGFFEKESLRLNSTNTSVLKTVSRNSIEETRKVTVNWINELSLFAESDINKPAWKKSYRKISNGEDVQYLALEDNLRTRRVRITRINNHVKSIHIINRTSNFLYNSSEDLVYYPDSVYIIEKQQQVKVLGTNHYLVTGKFR
jgi:hypothetical protein